MNKFTYVLTSAMCLGLLSGCTQAHGESVAFSVETEHFEIIVYEGAPNLCLGEYREIDHIVEMARGAVGYSSVPERATLHVYAAGEAGFPCDSWAGGCFLWPDNEVHVRDMRSLHHEVVHAAISPGLNDFFSEGFAESFSTTIPPSSDLAFDPRPLLESENTEFEYWQAAVFVNFLYETYGGELTYQIALSADVDGADSAFLDLTGKSVQQISDDFIASGTFCSAQAIRCSGEAESISDTWAFRSDFSCSSGDALGVDGGEYSVKLIEIEEGDYSITTDHASVYIESCAPCSNRESWSFGGILEPSTETINLSGGRHVLIIDAVPGFTADVQFERQT